MANLIASGNKDTTVNRNQTLLSQKKVQNNLPYLEKFIFAFRYSTKYKMT